jgi:hypothetical protein
MHPPARPALLIALEGLCAADLTRAFEERRYERKRPSFAVSSRVRGVDVVFGSWVFAPRLTIKIRAVASRLCLSTERLAQIASAQSPPGWPHRALTVDSRFAGGTGDSVRHGVRQVVFHPVLVDVGSATGRDRWQRAVRTDLGIGCV